MNLGRYIGVIGLHTALGRFLGYARDTLLVAVLGASAIADALFIATKIASLFRRLFTEGAFNASFVPIFGSLRSKKGDRKANYFAEQSIVWMLFILGVITAGVLYWVDDFVGMIAAGYRDDPDKFRWTIEFTEIVFPYIMLICMTAVIGGALNAVHSFIQTAASQTVGNLSIIGLFWGLKDSFSTPAHAAAWAILISAIVQFSWLYVVAFRSGMILLPRWPRLTSPLREFMMRLLPGILGTGMVQINVLVSIYFGSYLNDGGVSYLQITERINQFPLSIIGVSLGMVLIPLLTTEFQSDNKLKALETQNKAIGLSLGLAIPITAFIIVFSTLIVSALFMHGRFSAYDVLEASPCLVGFISGLPAYVLLKVFSSTFFAVKDTFRPSVSGAGAMLLNGAMCYLVITNKLMPELPNHVGIAVSLSVSGWVNTLTLAGWAYLRGLFLLDKCLLYSLLRVLTISTLMLLVIMALKTYVSGFVFHDNAIFRVSSLVCLIFISIAAYLGGNLLYKRVVRSL